jgi:hypothetical protein
MNINMEVLKRSKQKPQPGDIFVLKMKEREDYVFGRVISVTAKIRSMVGCILIYIYNSFSKSKDEIPVLDKENLLIPPRLINQLPWIKGYFEIVDSKPLMDKDVLKQHCFAEFTERFYDEQNNQLKERIEPCGEYGLDSYRTIDDDISRVLDILLAED